MISTPTDKRRSAGRTRARADVQPNFPAIVRPASLARAAMPEDVPEPQHHHLPAWVRRAYGQVRPIIGDQLAALSGDAHDRYVHAIGDLTARISEGKFSQAFNYPQLIAHGQQLIEQQRRENAELAREQRVLDNARRHAADAIKDAGSLPGDTATRLNKALRGAADMDEVKTVENEVRQAVSAARTGEERRREREISRTRNRIEKTSPRAPAASGGTEDWQDVLRRLQEQMAADHEGGTGSPLAHPP